MAFAATGVENGTSSKIANQSSAPILAGGTINAGELAVLIIAVDNNQTTDGDENAVTGVTDVGSNTWTKAAEFTNGQGGSQSGATCSIWYSVITTQLTSGQAITAAFSNATSRDASAMMLKVFSFGAGNTIAIEGTPGTLANDGADPGSLNVTTSNIECLRVRGIAAESSTTTALTTTASWTSMYSGAAGITTSGGGSASNMAVRGEYIISTGTGAASDPTLFSADCASVYVAFKEVGGATPKSEAETTGGISTQAQVVDIASTVNEAAPTTSGQSLASTFAAINEAAFTTETVNVALLLDPVNEPSFTTQASAVNITQTINEAAPSTEGQAVQTSATVNEAGPTTEASAITSTLTAVNEPAFSTESASIQEQLTLTPVNESAFTTEGQSVQIFATVNEASPSTAAQAIASTLTTVNENAFSIEGSTLVVNSTVNETAFSTEGSSLNITQTVAESFSSSESASVQVAGGPTTVNVNETAFNTASQTLAASLTAVNEASPSTESVILSLLVNTINEAAFNTESLALETATVISEAAPTISTADILITADLAEAFSSVEDIAIQIMVGPPTMPPLDIDVNSGKTTVDVNTGLRTINVNSGKTFINVNIGDPPA